MIYIGNFIDTDDTNIKMVGDIYMRPFETLQGTSEEELLASGVFLNELPPHIEAQIGKDAVLHYNMSEKQAFYRLVDRPLTLEEKLLLANAKIAETEDELTAQRNRSAATDADLAALMEAVYGA